MVNAHSTATPDFSDFPTKRHPHITAGKQACKAAVDFPTDSQLSSQQQGLFYSSILENLIVLMMVVKIVDSTGHARPKTSATPAFPQAE